MHVHCLYYLNSFTVRGLISCTINNSDCLVNSSWHGFSVFPLQIILLILTNN